MFIIVCCLNERPTSHHFLMKVPLTFCVGNTFCSRTPPKERFTCLNLCFQQSLSVLLFYFFNWLLSPFLFIYFSVNFCYFFKISLLFTCTLMLIADHIVFNGRYSGIVNSPISKYCMLSKIGDLETYNKLKLHNYHTHP